MLKVFLFLIMFSLFFPFAEGQFSAKSIESELSLKPFEIPELIFDKMKYSLSDDAVITVSHSSANRDFNVVENISAEVSGKKSGKKILIPLDETGPDTGIFSNSFPISSVTSVVGDVIEVKYTYFQNKKSKELTATAGTAFSAPKNNLKMWWSPKIDSKLLALKNSDTPQEFAKKKLIVFEQGQTLVTINLDDADKIRKIQEIGTIRSQSDGFFQIRVSLQDFEELDSILEDSFARVPSTAIQHSKISEGVKIMNIDKVHEAGVTGKKIRVGVIDLAFDPKNPEIKNNIKKTKSLRSGIFSDIPLIGQPNGQQVHGTAVAEIVVDVAPDVELYLYAMGTETEFLNAVNSAVSDNVDIIIMSAGWLDYPTDGKSPMTKKLEWAVSKGVVVVLSAGNYAYSHWQGNLDLNQDHFQLFGTDDSFSVNSSINQGDAPIKAYLLWDDPTLDLDLFLVDKRTNARVDESINQQSITSKAGLMEFISYNPLSGDGPFEIQVVAKNNFDSNSQIEIFSPNCCFDKFVPQSSVGVPTDAVGAMTVGAFDFENSQLEWYSSQGPTNFGSSVPDVVAPDKVTTLAQPMFEGTSAAAPHLAGVAALLLEQQPNLSPNELREKILRFADKKSVGLETSFDNKVGYGLVDTNFLNSKTQDLSANPSAVEPIQNPSKESAKENPLEKSDMGSPKTNNSEPTKPPLKIPVWIKDQAEWWINGAIQDEEFIQSIQYLMKKQIIIIPNLPGSLEKKETGIPQWIKTNAKWWTQEMISDREFALGIEYLVKNGIIKT